jgi:hypothetical protein
MANRELSTRELSDRLQINDLLIRYTRAIDTKDWALLDTCFTPDAHVDYTSAGGVAGDYPKVRAWLEKALAPFPMTVHALANSIVEIDGDRATARTVGAFYNDKLVWTDDGWKIRERIEETAFMDGSMPEALQIPE